MRKYSIEAAKTPDKWSNLGPYTAKMEIESLLQRFPDATEAEVEAIAKRNGCSIKWEEYHCKLPIGGTCPADQTVPMGKDIMVADCMAAKCPYLSAHGAQKREVEDSDIDN